MKLPKLSTREFFFLLVALLFIYFKSEVFADFSSRWTDHDQCTLWAAAMDASHGEFHEPCFYGQDYNTSLEAYLALPFIFIGMPVWLALPLVTTLMAISIFLLTGYTFYKRKKLLPAMIIMIIPMCMPVEYHLVSSMPRGFITGMFVVAVGVFLYELMTSPYRSFVLAFFLALGFWVNQNSVLMALPVLLWHLAEHRWKYWLQLMSGAIVGSLYKLATVLFYGAHPAYVYHNKPAGEFDLPNLTERIQHLDRYFFNATWILLICLSFTVLLAVYYRKYLFLLITLLFVIAFTLTLGFDRIGDGLQTTFYHLGRMYLPVVWSVAWLLALGIELTLYTSAMKFVNYVTGLCLLIASLTFLNAFRSSSEVIARETGRDDNGVIVYAVDEVLARNEKIIAYCKQHALDLVVFPENCKECWMDTYSIPALSDNRVQTLNLSEDRRGWRFEEELLCSDRRFLSMGDACSDGPKASLLAPDPVDSIIHGCYVLQINTNVPDYFRGHVKGVRVGY